MNRSARFDEKTVQALRTGAFQIEGQFTWGSNYTYLVDVRCDDTRIQGVYKPVHGEQPLWDFPPDSLAGREVAAFLVSEAGGWAFVPPTVYREDGPAGPGSLQLYIEHDPERHYFNFSKAQRQALRSTALFDAVINNTDRKGGHVIVERAEQRLWMIDHGICFHAQPKLRTVIWEFAGQPISAAEYEQISALAAKLAEDQTLHVELLKYLNKLEVLAMIYRINQLLEAGVFPHPVDERFSYPWPPV